VSDLVRLSFTIEESLSETMHGMAEARGYTNRSEFIRDLIRERIVAESWQADQEVIGTITLVYNHEKRMLSHKLTALQHQHHHAVLATTHVHMDRHVCAEMIMTKGKARIIQEMADEFRREKGVLHVAVAMSATGEELA
jgi:CopG family nickel-responsive transcriptional regulator